MNIQYKKASCADIELLVGTRMLVLRAVNGLDEAAELTEVERQSRRYYRHCFEEDTHAAYLVLDDGSFIGAGGISFYSVMPTVHNPSGRKAYLMNIYTAPEYRRRGIARGVVELLIKEALSRGITDISLEATDMGRPLYESCGFIPVPSEMKLSRESVDGMRL